MDRLIERLPSPGGVALWLYALTFVVLPALLAWNGFAYVIGIVIFAVGVHPQIHSLVEGAPIRIAFSWREQRHVWQWHLSVRNERWAVSLLSWGMIVMTVLVLPVIVFAVQTQSVVFYRQMDARLPEILAAVDSVLEFAHRRLPAIVPLIDVEAGSGWQGLSDTLKQVTGDALEDVKALIQSVFGSMLGVLGTLVGDWLKLVIGAIIVGTILSGWQKEVTMHRRLIEGGIRDERLRANVLRFGELYQIGVSLFMIGYIEVGLTLAVLFAAAMLVLPIGLSLAAIVFMAVVLGFVTAVPKIGGFLGMAVATLLMATNLEPGLGWFGWTVVSFGTGIDILIRTGLLLAATKVFGLMEAYSYTPDIIGEKLRMTKMQIIATVVIWAVGAGFFGMIWGVLIALAFQAAMRLAEERAEEDARAAATPDAVPQTPGQTAG